MKLHAAGLSTVIAVVNAMGSPVAAQSAYDCAPGTRLLLSCSNRGGERSLGLCQSGAEVSYAFGPSLGEPTLRMTRNFADVDYTPFTGGGTTIYESVTLWNGNTGYEVFTSSRLRVDPSAEAEGGIVVILPGGERQTVACDPGSVAPANPFDGIGALARLAGDGLDDPIGYCLERLAPADPATDCLGRLREVQMEQGQCDVGTDPSDCWTGERDAWDALLQERFDAALTYLPALTDPTYIDTLKVAQDTWAISRNLDCDILELNPFAADLGNAECKASYSAARVSYLQELIALAEFDG